MKTVKVQLQLSLRHYSKSQADVVTLEMDDKASVREVLERLRLVRGEVGVILINDQLATEEQELPDHATVILYPIFEGG